MTNSTRDGSDLTNPAMMPWPDFLMLVPPGETRGVLNYSQKPSLRGTLRGPDLMLECSVCNGARMFACPEDGDRFGLDEDGSFESYLSYHCKNCERGKKTYAVHIHFREAKAWATKYGEWPAFGGRLSSAFLDQFDDAEKALLPKGRQCENHGLGVGAFAYYRRVVEMHKNKLFDQIIEAVEKAGVKFMISLPSRSSKELLLARKAIDDGLLGDITFGRGRVAHSASLDKWFSGGSAWFVDGEQSGGGALFDLGCHRMDVIRWMMGEPKKVMAIINNVSPNYAIDDNSATIIEFANKGIGVVDVAFVHRSGPNPFELFGTEGSLTIGAGPLALTTTKLSDEEVADYVASAPEGLPSAMEQWIGAIEDGTEMSITIQDGRNLTELLQAAYMSSAQDRAIELPL